MAKRGRRASFARDSDGNEIRGLYLEKTSRKLADNKTQLVRYYSRNPDGSRVIHGSNLDTQAALFQFRQWQAAQDPTANVPIMRPALQGERDLIRRDLKARGRYQPADESILNHPGAVMFDRIPEAEYLARVKHDLENRLEWLAAGTNKPMLLRLASLPRPEKPLTLAEVRELFDGRLSKVIDPATGQPKMENRCTRTKVNTGKVRPVYDPTLYTPNQIRHHNSLIDGWDYFCRIIGKTNVDDITPEEVQRFKLAVEAKRYAPRTVKSLYDGLQTVLKHAWTMRENHREQVQRLQIRLRGVLKRPKVPEFNSDPMDLDEYRALIKAAPTKWKAFLTLALNIAAHPKECAEVLKSEVNLKKREFKSTRTKTGVLRCCVLWNHSVKYLSEYMETPEYQQNQTEFLFVTPRGNAYRTQRVNDMMKRLRTKAGLNGGDDPTGKFDPIRDLFATEADDIHFAAKQMTMGYKLPGEMDKYKRRNPQKTAALHESLEKLIFGQPKKGGKGK